MESTSASWDEAISDSETISIATPVDFSSLKSFWFGFLALASIPLISIPGLHVLGGWLCGLSKSPLVEFLQIGRTRGYWSLCLIVNETMSTLIQPMVAVSVMIPLLYWRGGVMVRFGLTLAIGLVLWNLSTTYETYSVLRQLPSKASLLVLIFLCWGGIPVICLYTPMKTSWLRAVVMCLLAATAFCLSVLFLQTNRNSMEIAYWLSLYLVTFAVSLVRRNWGTVAIVEMGQKAATIERTSSRTLLELMLISSVVCFVLVYWIERKSEDVVVISMLGMCIGLVLLMLTSAFYRYFLSERIRYLPLVLILIFTVVFLVLATTLNGYIAFLSRYDMLQIRSNPLVMLGGSVFALITSCVVVVHMVLCGVCLRGLGWRVVKRSTE